MSGMVIDSFAGGGGASLGIERALGRSPDVAINHNAEAIAMHRANHPDTLHLTENVWKVDPDALTRGRDVALLWASPDCRHHSKAKGGAPVSRSVRGLADVVLMWARVARPNVIILENVEEFRDWGPIVDGKPCPRSRGADFARWVRGLEAEGYEVEWRLLRACDYGAPTIRRRLYLVARRDGRPIVWPAPTHGDPKSEDARRGVLKPWRTAAEIIDWSLQCPSIFLTRDDAKAVGLKVQRPLADKTLARIARGFKRYLLDRAEPFLVVANHGDDGFRGQGLEAPFATVTASRDAHGVVTPYLVPRYQERDGQEPRTRGLDQPSATVVPGGNGPGSLIAPYLGVWRADHDGRPLDVPAPTVTANAFIARPGGAVPLGLARAQGFPDSYVLAAPFDGGALTETAQRARIGNSVCPDMAEALVRANVVEAMAMKPRRRRLASLPAPAPVTVVTPSFLDAAE